MKQTTHLKLRYFGKSKGLKYQTTTSAQYIIEAEWTQFQQEVEWCRR